jgi:hypothetical protein
MRSPCRHEIVDVDRRHVLQVGGRALRQLLEHRHVAFEQPQRRRLGRQRPNQRGIEIAHQLRQRLARQSQRQRVRGSGKRKVADVGGREHDSVAGLHRHRAAEL